MTTGSCFSTEVIQCSSFPFLGQEKKLVEEVFNNAIDCLSDEDKTLPQVKFYFNKAAL